MCVGQPMQVIDQIDEARARCDYRGEQHEIDIRLIGDVEPGEWLMTFLGAARERMDEGSARRALSAISAVEAIMSGGEVDIAAAFPDLVDREPQLPEHLRGDR
ncbi:HypC/HybG/HupF family hydrogenase formation chaperone [Erythrobacter sp. SCSIO 43205]|uniref:HypC/HybG/HupF family hydrogenase formation chaperone n=1 Tax=Erythrobacter sp. SCSIO 43205 TaxID=2779361 RepID=UPI001CA92D7F|nr:HypC/HybG/HupF family hydrogenase formation chaperone [Erythrobacter sp. SCSIO 43205]UAB77849.1 HypC/HybG/HupF family hydrogenase formation chaperone [Erythrobacter sp. SCSIO 43205]